MLTDHEYEWLTEWKGPPGAAYHAVYEDLLGNGFIKRDGTHLPKAREAIEDYELRHRL